MYSATFEASNKADWIFQISGVDRDTEEDIDFTDAEICVQVRDKPAEGGGQKLSATVGDGITLLSSTVIEVRFTAAQMASICSGEYDIGAVYSLNDETHQLFAGTATIYNGVASL